MYTYVDLPHMWCDWFPGDLETLLEGFSQRPGVQLAAVEMGIPGLCIHQV